MPDYGWMVLVLALLLLVGVAAILLAVEFLVDRENQPEPWQLAIPRPQGIKAIEAWLAETEPETADSATPIHRPSTSLSPASAPTT